MFELRDPSDGHNVYTFDRGKIVIGEGGDFTTSSGVLRPGHALIEWRDERYVMENRAHDPDTLINGKPFWRKKLEDGDLIHLGGTEFLFHQLSDCHFNSLEEPPVALSHKIHTVDEVLHAHPVFPHHRKPPKKDSYLHLVVLAFSCLFLFGVLFSTTFYITVTEKAEIERLYAARGIADIAMILHVAQEGTIEPPFQNWLDPTFLKEVGQKIIPKELSRFEWIDSEGRFLGGSYILRLYSDSNFSRFLLIAQPVANNWQSISPRATLVVDSDLMVIKEFSKVRDLNRLLLSTSGFEGIIKTEITDLILKADPVPLDSLAQGKEKRGFKVPDELKMLDPEAVYSIYNAPRYYLMHEPILELADKVARNPLDQNLKQRLDQALLNLGDRLPVLYTAKGIETVIGARKALSRKVDLLLGYIEFNHEGRIEDSHLVMPSQLSWSVSGAPSNPIDNKNLHEEVSLLLKRREENLKRPTLSLMELIESHLQNPDLLFFTHLYNQLDNYKLVSQTAQAHLDQCLKGLFEKYVLNSKSMDLNQFLAVLDEHQIDLGIGEDPQIFNRFYDPAIAFEAQLNHLFESIEETDSLDTLDTLVLVANDLLQQHSGGPSWKKHLKMLCIRKLETLLWNPEEEIGSDSFDMQWKVARILKHGYMNDTEGRSFYLSHFLEEEE